MAQVIKLKDFLKPSYEAIKRENMLKMVENTQKLFSMLEMDGTDVAKELIDFLSKAFVDIADGATCCEYENKFCNLEIYVNIKKRSHEE